MPRTVPLSVTATVKLDGTGAGIASIGPSAPGEIWYPAVASVKCSSNVSEATCRTYAGNQLSDSTFADGTTWGSTGDSTSNFAGPLYPGQQVFASWTGGDAAATATLVVTGTRSVP